MKVQTLVKLGLYKSLILPVLLYGFACVFASRADLHLLENFQKKVVGWITGNKTMSYRSQLKILNILPLPMFLQLNDVLLLSKITNEETGTSFSLPERPEIRGRSETFKLRKTRTEKGWSNFIFRNCRLVNRLDDYIDFMNTQRLKNRLLKLLWKLVDEKYSESNVCTWQLSCDCPTCRKKDIILKWRLGHWALQLKLRIPNNDNKKPGKATDLAESFIGGVIEVLILNNVIIAAIISQAMFSYPILCNSVHHGNHK